MKFSELLEKIKTVQIQGATNVAKAGVKGLRLTKDPKCIQKLIDARPTEPALKNAIKYAQKHGIQKALDHFEIADKKISKLGAALIKDKSVIYTHCHSSSVMDLLIEAKKQGKNFAVNNTETRPLFQGRRTSNDMAEHGIENYHFVDAAMRAAMKSANLVLLGCDAITETKVINKIGSKLQRDLRFQYTFVQILGNLMQAVSMGKKHLLNIGGIKKFGKITLKIQL